MNDCRYLISTTGKSKLISEALLALSIGESLGEVYSTITHPTNGQTAIEVFNMDSEVLVSPTADTTQLKELLNYTEAQKAELDAYIDTLRIDESGQEPVSGWVYGRFTIGSVTEGFIPIYGHQYMVDNDWFINE